MSSLMGIWGHLLIPLIDYEWFFGIIKSLKLNSPQSMADRVMDYECDTPAYSNP